MRDLGLIRSVGGQKFPARYDGIDHDRPVVVVDTGPEKRREPGGVFPASSPEVFHDLVFRFTGSDVQRPVQSRLFGQMRKKVLDRSETESVEHFPTLRFRLRQVTQWELLSYIASIIVRREQTFHFVLGRKPDSYKPGVSMRILVKPFRFVGQSLIDFNDVPGDR